MREWSAFFFCCTTPHTAIEVGVKTDLNFIMPTVSLLHDSAIITVCFYEDFIPSFSPLPSRTIHICVCKTIFNPLNLAKLMEWFSCLGSSGVSSRIRTSRRQWCMFCLLLKPTTQHPSRSIQQAPSPLCFNNLSASPLSLFPTSLPVNYRPGLISPPPSISWKWWGGIIACLNIN